MTPGVSIPGDASIPVFDFYLFLFFSPYIRISGNLWSGMTCSWCDGGLEGNTRVRVFVCVCGEALVTIYCPSTPSMLPPGALLAPRR